MPERAPGRDQPVTPETFSFTLNWPRLREACRREGSYLLRSTMARRDPAELCAFYLQLVEVEQAFKELKGRSGGPSDLPPDRRTHRGAHLRGVPRLLPSGHAEAPAAPGLTPRAVLDKMAGIQMVDVHLPATDGRTIVLSRYTEPEPDQALLLRQLTLRLPDQPPPCGADLFAAITANRRL